MIEIRLIYLIEFFSIFYFSGMIVGIVLKDFKNF